MEAMCHTPRERKSKFLIRSRMRANEEGTCGKERWDEISHLNQVGTIRWGEKKKRGKEKEK